MKKRKIIFSITVWVYCLTSQIIAKNESTSYTNKPDIIQHIEQTEKKYLPSNLSPKLTTEDAEQVFRFWDHLSSDEQLKLVEQINGLDTTLLQQQKRLATTPQEHSSYSFEPFQDFALSGHECDKLEGKKRIKAGEMGCLVLAGGQGSRLGYTSPKGTYPVSLIKNKTLFQLCAEKVLAASRQAGRPLLMAVMTSPANDEATRQFFANHDFFGLDPNQVFFFMQDMLPFLDIQGRLFLETPSQIALGPNGNGFCLHSFVHAGIWEKWIEQGVRYLNVIFIDNPLADPFDADLLGFHCRQKADVTSKSVRKKTATEKVGLFVRQDESVRVIEYSEMSEKDKAAKDSSGQLLYCCAHIGLFCFSMDFIRKVVDHTHLPLHRAWKTTPFANAKGETEYPVQPNAWKFEAFLFDVLNYTKHISIMLFPREECFAPLKNASGDDSLETVQKAIQDRDRTILRQLTGLEPPSAPFELSADFYYPTLEFEQQWKGRSIQGGYIKG